MNNQNNKPGVFDMISNYADQHNIPSDDIFKSDEPQSTIIPIRKDVPKKNVIPDNEPTEWTPSEEDISGLNEPKRTSGVILSKDEWKNHPDPIGATNILDDTATKSSLEQMDEMERVAYNVERSKARLGIKHLSVPTIFNSRIVDAGSDIDPDKAGARLDELISSIIEKFPASVVEWLPSDIPNEIEKPDTSESNDTTNGVIDDELTLIDDTNNTMPDAKIIIDKSKVSEISFTNDEIDKIKKSRSIELNIVETANIEYSIIEEDPNEDNSLTIDNILRQYTRKVNDMRVSMPASRYRASFTGLSYSEIIDLSYSQELNNIDGELKKWTIIFNHIKNPSIGEFKAYDIDDGRGNITKVTAFEDFLKKTSIMDLSFALWAVLCATCLDKEIVSINCHGEKCGNVYDWIYDPKSLVQMSSVPEVTLSDMKITGELMDRDEIMKHYNESMLMLSNSVKLPSSGFVICFGHISAYEYLKSRMADIIAIQEDDSLSLSSIFGMYGLNIIKYILLPDIDDNTRYRKISRGSDILKVVHTLDTLDSRVIDELMELMINPYRFKFALNNLVCPKCGIKSNLNIDDMSMLLFIIAQSLSSSEIKLIKL